MAVVNTFLAQHLSPGDVIKFSQYRVPNPVGGKELCLDCPIKSFEKFTAVALTRMHWMHYAGFATAVGNEGGAIIAALLAAGFTFMEIVEVVASGVLDIETLVEGKQKLPDRIHRRHSGAAHKGFRLRDAINALLRQKIPGAEDTPVSFAELFNAKRKRLLITVLDMSTAGIAVLSNDTFPAMGVADAVLASCAVQPYIAPFEHKVDKKNSIRFMACGHAQTLPIQTLISDRQLRKASGSLLDVLVAFGVKGTDNQAGIDKTSGKEVLRALQGQRAPANVPESLRAAVILI